MILQKEALLGSFVIHNVRDIRALLGNVHFFCCHKKYATKLNWMSKGLQRIYTMSCDCRNNLECWPLERYSTVPQILNSGRSNEKSRNLILIWYQFFLNILFYNKKSFFRLINVLPCKNKAWTIIIYQYFWINVLRYHLTTLWTWNVFTLLYP